MMVINNVFNTGQLVYLVTDEEQKKRLVIAITVYADGSLQYVLRSGTFESVHSACEMSAEENAVLKFK